MIGPTSHLFPYPVGWSNPQIVKISAALEAAGAWDTPLELGSAYAQKLTLHFTYTRGGAGGAFDWQLEVSSYSIAVLVPAGAQEWTSETILSAGVVAAGADTQSRVQREFQTYQATGAAVEDFVFGPLDLGGTIERYRVTARESGNVGAPGTLQITGELA